MKNNFKVEQSVKNLSEKNNRIYFLVQDTKGISLYRYSYDL